MESEGYFDALDAENNSISAAVSRSCTKMALKHSVSSMVSIADEDDIMEEQEVMSHNLKRVLTKPKPRRESQGLRKRETFNTQNTSAKRPSVSNLLRADVREVIELLSDDDDDDDDDDEKEFWGGEGDPEIEVNYFIISWFRHLSYLLHFFFFLLLFGIYVGRKR
jgi:hypothetical protein